MQDEQEPIDLKNREAGQGPQTINHFELRLEEGVAEGKHLTGGKVMLDSGIWVDGQYLDEPHVIDLPLLIQSLHVEGWYEIFTCGCGVGGCAGIVDGIHVTHHIGLIRWSFRRPQSARRLIGADLDEWQKTAKLVELTFDEDQMRKGIQTFLDTVRCMIGSEPHRFDWPVHGFSVRDLLSIDPRQGPYR